MSFQIGHDIIFFQFLTSHEFTEWKSAMRRLVTMFLEDKTPKVCQTQFQFSKEADDTPSIRGGKSRDAIYDITELHVNESKLSK